MIGSTISHYVVEDLLGEGGMGKVYRARDTVLNRTVAIKILGTSVGGDSESKRRILREARAACALNHPNVVTIHSVEEERELDFIVMEHVAGAPLTIPAAGLPIDQAIDYAVQITSALAAAHEAGIIHQDIKPANVMVGRTGHIKVLDFGIARRTELRGDAATRKLTDGTLNAAGVVAGTLGYISPEQISGEQASVRSDIFSLGAVLYEMLAGRPAFPGQSPWAVMDATVRAQPPSLLSLRRDVPSSLNRIVVRCLEKNPEARYPTAGAVQADLLAVKAEQSPASIGRSRSGQAAIAIGVVLALLAGGAIAWWRVRDSRVRWARETALPEATRLFGAGDPVGAYRLAAHALAAAPDDPQVVEGWTGLTTDRPIQSDPLDAEVAFRSYSGKDEGWISLGRTPTTARYPVGQMRWRITKDGYDPIEISPGQPLESAHLVPKGTTPDGMVHVPAGSVEIERDSSEVQLPPFWIDQYEVTNRAYKAFVDQGGYRQQRFWREAFVKDGRTLSWSEAMTELHDKTGRPGPSTWELGMYPDGQDDWPVSGVSWYEAAAYAAYANKQLPTVYHWQMASGAFGVFSEILRFSNFGGVGTGRVGSTGGLGPYGTYDMAGNVKEWCWNEVSAGKRYVLGGAFNESNYMFRDPDAQPTFERRAGFGFRCMQPQTAVDPKLLTPIASMTRDLAAIKPVGDEVYEAYRHLYDYDAVPLDSRLEETDTNNAHWRRERVTVRVPYSDERMSIYVFVPKDYPPPYQALVYFPGADAVMLQSSRAMWTQMIEFLPRSGRVVAYPVYQQTYERRVSGQQGPGFLRRISIERGQDVRRVVDYLQSRPDVDRTRVSFYGLSLGAQLAPVYLAIEPRFRTGVLLSGGIETWTIPPETDPVNFLPHVKQPVLMVNGREDFDLPYETAQVPMFKMLGTPEADKRHVVLEGGHIPPRPQEVFKEILDWLDRYLGPVAR